MPLTWIFPISSSFREPRKSDFLSTKICGQPKNKFISSYFLTMKFRLSFPALPRVAAAASLSVCLNHCSPIISYPLSALLVLCL